MICQLYSFHGFAGDVNAIADSGVVMAERFALHLIYFCSVLSVLHPSHTTFRQRAQSI